MRAEPYGCPQAVNSYESKGAVVFLLIRSDEYSFHESRVGMEVEYTRCTGFRICARSAEREIVTDNASKMGDRGRVTAIGMCASRICREKRARHRTREEEVACIPGEYVRNRQRRNTIVRRGGSARVRSGRHRKAGSQYKA